MYSAIFVTYFPQRPILGDNAEHIYGYDLIKKSQRCPAPRQALFQDTL